MIKNRLSEIKIKGYSSTPLLKEDENHNQSPLRDFSNIKINTKTLDDPTLDYGYFKRIDSRLGDQKTILTAINNGDLTELRKISNFYFRVSGIYSRICKYLANLYRYDWILTPYFADPSKINNSLSEKVTKNFYKVLNFLDDFNVKKFLTENALKVVVNGAYYGYKTYSKDGSVSIQELPINYCRSRFSVKGKPVVEFCMQYFDTCSKDGVEKEKILKIFPPEFRIGYNKYKNGELESGPWYVLNTDYAFKFNISNNDFPILVTVVPSIIDLDDAKALDKKKLEQQLLKILIQKMPLDKNGELVFDIDEVQSLHNNAVHMLDKAVGVNVLTTFADVSVEDMADRSSVTSIDELDHVERAIYNESGTAQNLFNTDGNIALEKSILNDEASIYNLLLEFQDFLNELIEVFNKNNSKYSFRVQLLNTTIYNYKDMAKSFKDLVSMGYSKVLPLIALGQSQSSVLANAYFENKVLDLVKIFVPPITSSTMNSDSLAALGESKEPGREEKPDDEKSDKTLANQESIN